MESLYKQANCTGHNWPRRYVNILWAALYRSIDVRYFSLEVRFFNVFTQTLTALFDTYGRESEIIGNSRPLKSWPSKFSPALSLGIRINQCWETLRRHELLLFYIIQGVQHWSVPFERAKKHRNVYFQENIGHFDIHAQTLRKKFLSKKILTQKIRIFFQMKFFVIFFNFFCKVRAWLSKCL